MNIPETKVGRSAEGLPDRAGWDFTAVRLNFLGSSLLYEYTASSGRIISALESWFQSCLFDPVTNDQTDVTVRAFINTGLCPLNEAQRDLLVNQSPFSSAFVPTFCAVAPGLLTGVPWQRLSIKQKRQLQRLYFWVWRIHPLEICSIGKCLPALKFGQQTLRGSCSQLTIDIDWDYGDNEIVAAFENQLKTLRPKRSEFTHGRSAQEPWVRLKELSAFRLHREGVSFESFKTAMATKGTHPDDPNSVLPTYSSERAWFKAIARAESWIQHLEAGSIHFTRTHAVRKKIPSIH